MKAFENVVTVKKLANVQYFEFANNFHSVKHSHNFYEMVYADSGFVSAESEHFSGKICEGELILHMPNEQHCLETYGMSAPNVIIIGFSADCDMLNDFCNKTVKLLPQEKKLLVEIIREARCVYLPPYDVPYDADMKKRTQFPYGADQMIKILLEQFLIKFVRSGEKIAQNSDNIDTDAAPLVTEICNYIKNNLSEDLSLKTLVTLFCINKTTLCKIFKSEKDCTISDYINRQRIKKAKILMRGGGVTFTQISETLNFSSVHYFSKVFSLYEKITPTTYIQSVKSKLEN